MITNADTDRFVVEAKTPDGTRYVSDVNPIRYTPHLHEGVHLPKRVAISMAERITRRGTPSFARDSSLFPRADVDPPQ